MGKKLVDIYDAIKKDEGLRGQMRLAMITGLSSVKVKDTPDTPELLKKFANAYKEITQKECPVK